MAGLPSRLTKPRATPPGRGSDNPDAPAPPNAKIGLGDFPFAFWLINSIELLERGAYYGMVAILTFHFVTQKGFPTPVVGALTGVLLILLYFVPLVAAALAEKYGYRPSLVAAFTLALFGYVGLGSTDAFRAALGPLALLPGVILFGIGAGAFKVIAAAAVAKSTRPEQRNFGYTIYYALINVGGFLGPFIIGVAVPEALYGLVFFGAAALIGVNLILTLVLYRNPSPPQPDKSVGKALAGLMEMRNDKVFLLLLVVYSGFWMMYAPYQFFAPLYMTDFAIMPPWFNVALQQTINPAVIILVGPLVGRFVSKRPSLSIMIGGATLVVVGLATMGFVASPILFVAGIAIVSLGEVMTQPSFLSYTSKIAPADKTAVYLGYSFLPIGIGQALGSTIGGIVYAEVVEKGHAPALFWAFFAAIGLATIAGLLYVNKLMGNRGTTTEAVSKRTQRVLASRATPLVAALLVPALILAGMGMGTQAFLRSGIEPAGPGEHLASVNFKAVTLPSLSGTTNEKQTSAQNVMVLEAGSRNVTFTLKWTDEASAAPGPLAGAGVAQNQPDKFKLHVQTPDGRTVDSPEVANAAGAQGAITLRIPEVQGKATNGTYQVGVELTDAGDNSVGPASTTPDTSNAWTLDTVYEAPAMGAAPATG